MYMYMLYNVHVLVVMLCFYMYTCVGSQAQATERGSSVGGGRLSGAGTGV